jgi:hypothetical protein
MGRYYRTKKLQPFKDIYVGVNSLEKLCSKCKTIRPLTAFRKDYKREYGYHSQCTVCQNAYGKQYRERKK